MSRAGEQYLTPESSRRLVVDEKEDGRTKRKRILKKKRVKRPLRRVISKRDLERTSTSNP